MGSYILILLLIAVFIVLISGVLLMGRGGVVNNKYGNKLMIARVSLQGAILLVLVIMFMVGSK